MLDRESGRKKMSRDDVIRTVRLTALLLGIGTITAERLLAEPMGRKVSEEETELFSLRFVPDGDSLLFASAALAGEDAATAAGAAGVLRKRISERKRQAKRESEIVRCAMWRCLMRSSRGRQFLRQAKGDRTRRSL